MITDRGVRDLIAGLHTLSSSLAGQMMFGDSTVTVDASAPYLVVDLSGPDDDTLTVLMVAVTGWIIGLWGTDRQALSLFAENEGPIRSVVSLRFKWVQSQSDLLRSPSSKG